MKVYNPSPKSLLLLAVLLTIACGAPAYIAPDDTSIPIYQINATATNTPEMLITVLVPLTVRDAPCKSSDVIGYLEAGAVVQAVGNPVLCPEDGGQWIEIDRPHGFVNMRYVEEQ